MQVKVYGMKSGTVYATGEKIDCLRELHKKFPDFHKGIKKDIVNNPIYDEPLAIKPIR